MKDYSELYKSSLLDDIIPFWELNSLDKANGGYYTCLNRKGEVFDKEKFIWLQGRQAWMFALMFNQIEKKKSWLEISKLGIDFLKNKAMDADGNFYFSTTETGSPLIQPYNIFSDCFAAMVSRSR